MRQRLIVLNLSQELVTHIWFHRHPVLPWQVTYLIVLRQVSGSIHPAPLEIHPFLKLMHSILDSNVVGASVHLSTAHAAVIVSEGP